MTTTTLPAPRNSRRTLLLLACVFFLPFIIGSGMFWMDWRPGNFGNHGELIQPARPLPATGLLRLDGRPLASAELQGKWLLALPINSSCNSDCQSSVEQMQRIHAAAGKERTRLRLLLISADTPASADQLQLNDLQQRFPDLLVALVGGSAAPMWRQTLTGDGRAMFVVDPLGNVMMRHADANDTRGLLKDIERLLKYSWIR